MNGLWRKKLLGLVLLGTAAGVGTPVFAVQLSDYQWEKRPLLLFAPNHQHGSLRHTLSALGRTPCERNDRNMVVAVLLVEGPSHIGDETIPQGDAARIRAAYGIKDNQFAALLIGKDGGEKYRTYETPDLSEIFARIDGMPMRRREMARHPVDCGNTPQ